MKSLLPILLPVAVASSAGYSQAIFKPSLDNCIRAFGDSFRRCEATTNTIKAADLDTTELDFLDENDRRSLIAKNTLKVQLACDLFPTRYTASVTYDGRTLPIDITQPSATYSISAPIESITNQSYKFDLSFNKLSQIPSGCEIKVMSNSTDLSLLDGAAEIALIDDELVIIDDSILSFDTNISLFDSLAKILAEVTTLRTELADNDKIRDAAVAAKEDISEAIVLISSQESLRDRLADIGNLIALSNVLSSTSTAEDPIEILTDEDLQAIIDYKDEAKTIVEELKTKKQGLLERQIYLVQKKAYFEGLN